MGRSRNLASLASNIDNTGAIQAEGLSATISLGGVDTYDSASLLPISGLINGDQAFVGNRLYISNGSGWYNVGLVNLNPSIDSGPGGTQYILDSNGGIATSITLSASDSDETPILWTYTTSDSAYDLSTITNDSNGGFTVTAKSLADILTAGYDSTGGSFIVTFKASDGISFDTDSASFSLTYFVSAVGSLYDWTSATDNEVVDAPTQSRYNGAFGQAVIATEDYLLVGDPTAVITPNTTYVGSIFPYSISNLDGSLSYIGQSTPQNPTTGYNMGGRWKMDAIDDPSDTSIPVKYATGTNSEIVYINGITSGGAINGGQGGIIKRLNDPVAGEGWGNSVALGRHPAGTAGSDMFLVVGAWRKNSFAGGFYVYNSDGNNNNNWPLGSAPDYTITGSSTQRLAYPVHTTQGWIVALQQLKAHEVYFYEPTTSMAWDTTPQIVTCTGVGTTLVSPSGLNGSKAAGDYCAIGTFHDSTKDGIVLVIKLIDGIWTEYATITAPAGYNVSNFGWGIALHEDGLIAISTSVGGHSAAVSEASSTSDPDWAYNGNTVFIFEDNGTTFDFKGIVRRQSGTTFFTSTNYGFPNVDAGNFGYNMDFSTAGDQLFVGAPDGRVSTSSNYGGVLHTYDVPAK